MVVDTGCGGGDGSRSNAVRVLVVVAALWDKNKWLGVTVPPAGCWKGQQRWEQAGTAAPVSLGACHALGTRG